MNKRQEKISRMIINYLGKNPKAGDTLEGIARWWLQFERIELSMNEIADALKGLLQKGLIRMHKVRDVTTFYKVSDD